MSISQTDMYLTRLAEFKQFRDCDVFHEQKFVQYKMDPFYFTYEETSSQVEYGYLENGTEYKPNHGKSALLQSISSEQVSTYQKPTKSKRENAKIASLQSNHVKRNAS